MSTWWLHGQEINMRARITEQLVNSIPTPSKGQLFIRDTKLSGFGVRITANGVRSFIIEKRVNGSNPRKTLGKHPLMTVAQARAKAFKYLSDIENGINPFEIERLERLQLITLHELFEAYISTNNLLKDSTVEDYRKAINYGFKDWKTRNITSISSDMILKRHRQLGKRSHARANGSMRVLRLLFNFYIKMYSTPAGTPIIPNNPVDCLKHANAWFRVSPRRRCISKSELKDWYDSVMSIPGKNPGRSATTARDYLLLSLFTGFRKQETANLKWVDINFNEKTITLPDTKNSNVHILPMSEYIYNLLMKRKDNNSEYVFPGKNLNNPVNSINRHIKKIINETGIKFSLHDLRRTFASSAAINCNSIYIIKRLLNHKISSDVTEGYINLEVERLRKPMQLITDSLLQDCTLTAISNVRHIKEFY